MKALLYRSSAVVGRHYNGPDGLYRVIEVGHEMNHLPGGRGLFECEVMKVGDTKLTDSELREKDKCEL